MFSFTVLNVLPSIIFLLLNSTISAKECYKFIKNNNSILDNFWISNIEQDICERKNNRSGDNILRTEINFEQLETYETLYNESNAAWFLNIPLLPVLFASSPTLPEGNCKKQSQRYLQELYNGTLWAVRMFDSSTKFPEGILTGHTRHFGNFDECYDLKAEISNDKFNKKSEVIGGKYCLLKVEYHKLNNFNGQTTSNLHSLEFDPNGSMWEAIKEKGDFRRVKRYILELALCVPDVCTTLDIEKALQKPLEQIGSSWQILIKTKVKGNCQARIDEPVFSTSAKIFCCVILGLLVLVGVSTWYDSILKIDEQIDINNSLATDIFLCFSIQRNFLSITRRNSTHPGLDSIHLIRSIFMCICIFGHRLMQYYSNPMINSEYLENVYTLPSSTLLFNGPIIVESFFSFGGMLLAFYLLAELDKKKKINFTSAVLIRYFRLTPSYLIVIAFIALILPHLGSGPYWDYKIGLESSSCKENWWANILYINNYINTDKLCMFQSWYISVDYHLYILGLFVVYFFWKLPRTIGYPFLLSIIALGCSIPFYLSYFYKVQPMYRGLPYMQEVREDPYFTDHYIKTHERLAPYFVGVLAGAIIYDHRLSGWKIPKFWSQIFFIIFAVILSIKIQNLGAQFYDPNANPSDFEIALYASLNRPLFAVGIVSIVVFLTMGDGLEFHHKFFKPNWAQPVAKLTYGVYLIHNIHQSYDVGMVRHPRTFSIYNALWDLVPDVVYSSLLSLLLVLIIEGPFRKIEKCLITKRSTT